MMCPWCGADDDRVVDSRAAEDGAAIRRRRLCERCGRRFTTYERVEPARPLTVVKRDGSRVGFDREKILEGIRAACGKRPIPEARKTALVAEVEASLHRDFEGEVASAEIGRRIMAGLREIDGIAYLRYASEYYMFRDVDDLAGELAELQRKVSPPPEQPPLF